MKKLVLLICLINCTCFANSQRRHTNDPDKIYTVVEKEPQFPGGQEKFLVSLQKSIHVPESCLKDVTNTKVIIGFIVEKDGSLAHIKAVRGGCPAINQNIISFLKRGPKWEPGSQAGKACRVRYMIPVQIELSQEE